MAPLELVLVVKKFLTVGLSISDDSEADSKTLESHRFRTCSSPFRHWRNQPIRVGFFIGQERYYIAYAQGDDSDLHGQTHEVKGT